MKVNIYLGTGIQGLTLPSTGQMIKTRSNALEDVALSGDNYTFQRRTNSSGNEGKETNSKTPLIGRKLFDNPSPLKEESSNNESREHNKSKRGLLYDTSDNNMYIENLNISDIEQRRLLSDAKKYKDLEEIENRNALQLEFNNFLDEHSLFQINENEQENVDSSTEKIDNIKSSFVDNQCESKILPLNNEFSASNFVSRESGSKMSGLKWRSFVKESSKYSNAEEDHENTTISKFLANIDWKYQTNNSTAAKRKKLREEQIYEDNYDECKKIIDFKDASNIKETPNISNASNIKNYGTNENEKSNDSKFLSRHSRSRSIIRDNPVPIKEVWIYDTQNYKYNTDDQVETKNSNIDQNDQILIESERNNSKNSIIEFKPSSKFIDFDNQIDIQISNSSKINNNMKSNAINSYTDWTISKSDINPIRKHSPSMIEINKFNTLSDLSIRKTTFIGDSKWKLLKTRNHMNYEIISKFNTHKASFEDSKHSSASKQLECNQKSKSNNRKYEFKKKSSVYDYKQQSLKTYDLTKSQSISKCNEQLSSYDDHIALNKDSENKKSSIQPSRIPKVSKPTKTIKMNISGDDSRNLKLFDSSLRSSKESISWHGSMASK